MEELLRRLAALEERNRELAARVAQLEGLEVQTSIPDWAQEAVNKAVARGIVDTPAGGSLDFYRILTILNRKGLLE